MLKEKASYPLNLPVNVSMQSVGEYPIHYHLSDLELIVVLEGEVKLIEGYRTLLLKQGDVFIVNEWELHGLYSTGGENKILFVQFDLNYFQRRDKNFSCFFLMVDTYFKDRKYSEPERELKVKVFELVRLILETGTEAVQRVAEQSTALLRFMLDNFQYFSVCENSFFINRIDRKENQAQTKRVNDLFRYIAENYADKITLGEYAAANHISMHYMSHLMKDAVGMSFQELLNFTRMEASEKLLLETNKSVGEIAFECGFSATRYYVKCFEKWYKSSPEEYRETHRKRALAEISRRVYKEDDILGTIQMDGDYIIHRETIHYAKVVRADLRISGRKRASEQPVLIWNDRYEPDDQNTLKLIGNVFLDIGQCTDRELFWLVRTGELNRFAGVYVREGPGAGKDRYAAKLTLLQELVKLRQGSGGIKVYKSKASSTDAGQKSFFYDSIYCTPLLLREYITQARCREIHMFDVQEKSGGMLHGQRGLLTWNGIPKPAFYAYVFYRAMGQEVLLKDQDVLITRKGKDVQMLFYDCCRELAGKVHGLTSLEQVFNFGKEARGFREYAVELKNIKGRYKILQQELTADQCLLGKWVDMGAPEIFSEEEEELLKQSLSPKTSITVAEMNESFDITVSISQYGIKLVRFEKMD